MCWVIHFDFVILIKSLALAYLKCLSAAALRQLSTDHVAISSLLFLCNITFFHLILSR